MGRAAQTGGILGQWPPQGGGTTLLTSAPTNHEGSRARDFRDFAGPSVPTRSLPAPRARREHRGVDTLLAREALSKRLWGRALPAGQSSALVRTRAR